MRIKCLVVVYGTRSLIKDKPLASKETEIEVGDGFTREQIEAELSKINRAANKRPEFRRGALRCEMVLTETGGVPV